MSARRFECVEGSASKFWEVSVEGPALVTRYGRIGTTGQMAEKTLASETAAEAMREKLIREKLAKGYVEIDATGGASKPKRIDEPKPTASTKESARASAPVKAKAKPMNAPSDVALDGRTNRFVSPSGERVDLRIGEGELPEKMALKARVSTRHALLWSPKGDRIVTKLDELTLFAPAPNGGWAARAFDIGDVAIAAYAWSPDGTRLAVVALSDLVGSDWKANVLLLDADGRETSRFPIAPVRMERGQAQVSLSTSSDGNLVVHDEANGTRVYTVEGKKVGKAAKEWLSYSPDRQLSIDEDGRVLDQDGRVRFTIEGRFSWLGKSEVLVFQESPTPGMYRVVIDSNGTPTPRRVIACDKPTSIVMGPRGESVGLAYREGRIDVYALASGERTRTFNLPEADNSGLAFSFAPDGRIVVGVEWKKELLFYGTAPKAALFVRRAASEADPRKEIRKPFDTVAAAKDAANKEAAALRKKGFELEAIDPVQTDSERMRLEALRRLASGSLHNASIVTLFPPAGSNEAGTGAIRFRLKSHGGGDVTCPACRKAMPCLLEIDLAALPPETRLAGDGVVQVFYCEGACEERTKAWEPGPGRSKLVRIVPCKPKPLEWCSEPDAPALEELEVASGMKTPKALKTAKLSEEEWPGPREGDKVGGYPAWIQAPASPKCPDCKADMTTLVAQLESGGGAGVQFGDMGRAFVLRCPTHHDQLELIWQS